MMDTILQILQWAIPSGGIGAAIGWIVNHKAHEAHTAKDIHDTYKAMYEDVSKALEETQKKYEKIQKLFEDAGSETADLKRAVNRLQRAITSAKRCKHYDVCPIRDELQDSGTDCNKQQVGCARESNTAENAPGQHKARQREHRDKKDADDGTTGHSSGDCGNVAAGQPA